MIKKAAALLSDIKPYFRKSALAGQQAFSASNNLIFRSKKADSP